MTTGATIKTLAFAFTFVIVTALLVACTTETSEDAPTATGTATAEPLATGRPPLTAIPLPPTTTPLPPPPGPLPPTTTPLPPLPSPLPPTAARACATMEPVESYDIFLELRVEQDGVPTGDDGAIEAMVSGGDYHAVATVLSDGQTDELIAVDGVLYGRSSLDGPEWTVLELSPNDPRSIPWLTDILLCPDLSEFRALGEETVEGMRLWRYTNRTEDSDKFADVDSSFRGIDAVVESDVWVDDDGWLFHRINDFYQLHQYDNNRLTGRATYTLWFSELGEPNIITAPPMDAIALPTPWPPPGRACVAMEPVESFDLLIEAREEWTGEPSKIHQTVEMVVSGVDYHEITDWYWYNNWRVTEYTSEYISVDDVLYFRRSIDGPRWTETGNKPENPRRLIPRSYMFQIRSLCPDTSAPGLRALGEETVNGVRLRRFTSRTDDTDRFAQVDSSTIGTHSVEEIEFWVDYEGWLVHLVSYVYLLTQDDSGRKTGTRTRTAWVSEINKPNIITAPTPLPFTEMACAAMEPIKSFDMYYEVTRKQNGEPLRFGVTGEMVVSGVDYYEIKTIHHSGQTAEYMAVDGVLYMRESVHGPEWSVSENSVGDPRTIFPSSIVESLCLDLDKRGFRALGEETVNGVRLGLFTNRSEDTDKFDRVDSSFRGTKVLKEADVWVDDEGWIVQMTEYVHFLNQDDDGRVIEVRTTSMWFSELNEPNIITAPEVQ